jgi:hypothetical protein
MAITDLLRKFMARKHRFKEMQEEHTLQKKLEQRQKNSNERELERYFEEERQRRMKIQLDNIHKKQRDEFWHDDSILNQKNVFTGGESILNQPSLLKQEGNILKNQNMFFR